MRIPSANWKLWFAGAGAAVALVLVIVAVLFPSRAHAPIQFRDVTRRTRVTFRHTDGSGGKRYIVETVASGLATFDYDGDGRIDIYFLNGKPLKGTATTDEPKNRLYRNVGGFRFEDVTEEAGVGDTGYGLGVTIGDYDNDGRPDIYVSNFGPNVLYRNQGNGTFSDVTEEAGVGDGDKVGAGACFLDVEEDGDLDLYVANYVAFSYDTYVPSTWEGFHVYPGPNQFDPMRDTLFRNNGDGTFTDVSMESGIANHPGTGMGMVCADYDSDGDVDLFVLNDVLGNSCFENDGTGKFEEVAMLNAFKYNGQGQALASMGVDCADYDNDGWLDFFQTDYHYESPVLFRNLGSGTLEDVTMRTGVADCGTVNVKWGCGFADFDNDGYKDIFYVFGHVNDNIELIDSTASYEGCPVLLRNTQNGKFENISDRAGDLAEVRVVGRGVALDDLDNDGRVDVVILSSRRPPVILRNESNNGNHWLELELRGVKANRDGVGARVKVAAGDLIQTGEKHSGRGYQSHFGSRLHFGLGKRNRVDRIEVRWPGGRVDVFQDVAADQLIILTEGGRLTQTKGRPRDNAPRG